MVRLHGCFRAFMVPMVCVGLFGSTGGVKATRADAACAGLARSSGNSVAAGRQYVSLAYAALSRDRARLAGIGPQQASMSLSVVAEQHSAYMASIGTWADGDPAGNILERVRAVGVSATYAGQNVVTASGPTVAAAIANGDAFFAREATTGGPHWENITNPNHRYVGMGIALLGQPGYYTIYLTQVFSDGGGCVAQLFSDAGSIVTQLRIGEIARPSIDPTTLRTEANGMVISQVHPRNRLQVIDLRDNWAQVHVLHTSMYGWVYAPLLTPA